MLENVSGFFKRKLQCPKTLSVSKSTSNSFILIYSIRLKIFQRLNQRQLVIGRMMKDGRKERGLGAGYNGINS